MSMGLTPRMRKLLVYIQARELCPSFEEMRAALGLSSKCLVSRALEDLERGGYIRRLPNRARAIEVLIPADKAPVARHPDIAHLPIYRPLRWRPELPALSDYDRRALVRRGG